MTLLDLIAHYRALADDRVKPYFIEDGLLTFFANEAQDQACRRARLIVDASSDFLTIEVEPGEPLVVLDRRVLDVLRGDAEHDERYTFLPPVSVAFMDSHYGQWQSDEGMPQQIITNWQTGAIRLHPAPNVPIQLRLQVVRLPLAPMQADTDEPEIRPEHHPALVQWMLHRGFSIPDSEQFDPGRAALALQQFQNEFGELHGARNEAWMRDRLLCMPPSIA
jgi:hypothetical protein